MHILPDWLLHTAELLHWVNSSLERLELLIIIGVAQEFLINAPTLRMTWLLHPVSGHYHRPFLKFVEGECHIILIAFSIYSGSACHSIDYSSTVSFCVLQFSKISGTQVDHLQLCSIKWRSVRPKHFVKKSLPQGELELPFPKYLHVTSHSLE